MLDRYVSFVSNFFFLIFSASENSSVDVSIELEKTHLFVNISPSKTKLDKEVGLFIGYSHNFLHFHKVTSCVLVRSSPERRARFLFFIY